MSKQTVKRHSASVRIIHWAVAISGLVLLFSGIGQLPMYKRYNLIKVPGFSWANNFELTFQMHMIAASVFVAAAVFHMIYHFRRKEFEAMPKKGDVKESIHIMKAIVTGGEEPPHGKFLSEQRLAYIAIGAVSLILIVTGLIKVYKNLHSVTLDPTFLTVVTMTHTVATMLFLFLFISHLGAFLIKANLPLLPSMFTGTVDKKYADERHPLWKYKGKDHMDSEKRVHA